VRSLVAETEFLEREPRTGNQDGGRESQRRETAQPAAVAIPPDSTRSLQDEIGSDAVD
jgi:hypothetical protein